MFLFLDGQLSDNLVVLITSTGGHVGWPVGIFPWLRRWIFQNTLTTEFLEAIAKDLRRQETMNDLVQRGNHDTDAEQPSLSEMLFF